MVQKPLKPHSTKPFDGLLVGVIFQARERGLRGQGIGFTHKGLKGGIVAQRVGVVTVLVARADLINSLAQHLMGVMLDEQRITPVVEKPVEFLRERELHIKLAQEQEARVASDLAAVKIDNDFRLKTKRELSKTLCSHRSSVCCVRLIWSSTLFLA